MIENALLEMRLFESAKETENKLRWDTLVSGTKFSLYIPKWRVPNPWPSRIWIDVRPRRAEAHDAANLQRSDVEDDPCLTLEPIVVSLRKVSVHTQTIRYCPTGDAKLWETGEPYIPTEMTFGKSERLRLLVLWDVTSRGSFE